MRIAARPLNTQAITLEEAQSRIKVAVRDQWFAQSSVFALEKKVTEIINSALANIRIPTLKDAAKRSLIQFYKTQRLTVRAISAASLLLYFSLVKLQGGEQAQIPFAKQIHLERAQNEAARFFNLPVSSIKNYGVPLEKYAEDYFRDNIQPVLDKMAAEEALDPDSEKYFEHRATLRNRAEREVRWQGHQDSMNDFKSRGVKLVIVSSHVNCSDRCRRWQGRVYSLDGTSGKTDDGRKYVPIEEAIYNEEDREKYGGGKWYNGLFGFNCRHFMVEYADGREFPRVSAEEESKEYEIDLRQRALERNVRKWREKALMEKNTGNREEYSRARKKAIEWNKAYIAYSKANNRAYYPSRTQII